MSILPLDLLNSLFTSARDDVLAAISENADEVLSDYGVSNSRNRLAFFLAQLAHESGGFRIFEENLNYSASRLMAVWPKRFPTIGLANKYAKNAKALGNKVYANRLGNGNEASGDGYRYRGRGFIQITGKDNYREIGNIIGLDLVKDPDLAAEPEHMLLIACGYWKYRNLNKYSDANDFTGLTKAINGGLVGLDERKFWLKKVNAKLAAFAIDPSDVELPAAKPEVIFVPQPAPVESDVDMPPPKSLLKLGSRGEQVRAVQQSLKNLGFQPGAIDGVFGPLTAREVMLFQLQNGIETNGIVDESFWAAMENAKPIVLEPERLTETASDLKAKGSQIIKDGDRTKWLGWGASLLGLLGIGNSAVVNSAGSNTANGGAETVAGLQNLIATLPPDLVSKNEQLAKLVEVVNTLKPGELTAAGAQPIFDQFANIFAPGVMHTGAEGLAAFAGSLLPGFAGSGVTLAAGLLASYLGQRIVNKRTEDHRTGANTGK